MSTTIFGNEIFVALLDVESRARALTKDQFLATVPMPVLLFSSVEAGNTPENGTPTASFQTIKGKSGGASRFDNLVARLAKRPGNPFEQMITIGRAPNNDVVLGVPSISKFHGCFMRLGRSWYFTSHATLNGTQLNGDPVAEKQKRAVNDKDVLRFGSELDAVFLEPASLYARLHGEG